MLCQVLGNFFNPFLNQTLTASILKLSGCYILKRQLLRLFVYRVSFNLHMFCEMLVYAPLLQYKTFLFLNFLFLNRLNLYEFHRFG